MWNYIDIIYVSIKINIYLIIKIQYLLKSPCLGTVKRNPKGPKIDTLQNNIGSSPLSFWPQVFQVIHWVGGFEAEVRVLVLKAFSRSIYHRQCSFMIAHPFLFCPARRNLCWKISYPIFGCIATITPTEIRRNYEQINQ